MPKQTTRSFTPTGSRYMFDSRLTAGKGWAQVDNVQDASYFGQWANPYQRKLVSYCEGDITIVRCDTDDEFVAELRAWCSFQDTHRGLDPGLNDELEARLLELGFEDLFHWECCTVGCSDRKATFRGLYCPAHELSETARRKGAT